MTVIDYAQMFEENGTKASAVMPLPSKEVFNARPGSKSPRGRANMLSVPGRNGSRSRSGSANNRGPAAAGNMSPARMMGGPSLGGARQNTSNVRGSLGHMAGMGEDDSGASEIQAQIDAFLKEDVKFADAPKNHQGFKTRSNVKCDGYTMTKTAVRTYKLIGGSEKVCQATVTKQVEK